VRRRGGGSPPPTFGEGLHKSLPHGSELLRSQGGGVTDNRRSNNKGGGGRKLDAPRRGRDGAGEGVDGGDEGVAKGLEVRAQILQRGGGENSVRRGDGGTLFFRVAKTA
jgi:hypothetical protein